VVEIEERHKKGQPILVGTTSVAKSERLSRMLKKKSVKHNVLNAVNHEAEATIIAQAGRLGAVTIATNMAGRGTDILLGGNPDFLARSDMENEWISRAAKLPVGRAGRYEDALRELRETYDEEVQKAEKRYVKDGEVYERQRSEALKRSTEIQRQVRELSPFRDKRERYEDLSATELIEALHGMRPIPQSYLQAKQDLEASFLQGSDGNGGDTTKLLTRHGRISANASIAGNKKTANGKTYLRRWMKNGETTSSGPMISSSTGLFWCWGRENTPRS
jgi:hypothetical protein